MHMFILVTQLVRNSGSILISLENDCSLVFMATESKSNIIYY